LLAWAQADTNRQLKGALILPGRITDGTFNAAADHGSRTRKRSFLDIKVCRSGKSSGPPVSRRSPEEALTGLCA